MKILVADDSRVMRQIVVRTLRQAGYGDHEVIEAENGREAFIIAQTADLDLILSDTGMPEMNGIDFLVALRAAGSQIPFGFVTAEDSEEMRARAEAAGARFLIAKPVTPEAVAEALAAVW
jgi:two-component system chemotaxis response regulator CheY